MGSTPTETTLPQIPTQTHNEFLIEYLQEALAASKEPLVASKLQKCIDMATGLENYLETTCPEETPLQKRIYADTLAMPMRENFEKGLTLFEFSLNMMNARQPTQFLKTITEISRAERVLEIGMFTGYSAAIFCAADCVKSVTALEIDPFMVNFVKSHFSGTEEDKKLRIFTGPALESLETLKKAGETFDLVFIDADKANYLNYYKFVMDNNLIGSNGVIMLDNTLWCGELYPKPLTSRGKMFVDLNDYINNDKRVSQVILQISDGVSLIRRK